ncbi:MAG: hypothetical protein ACSHWY_02845 [Octadecabacter sp.]
MKNLSSWAEREWPKRWNDQFGMAALKETIDGFLPDGLDHAHRIEPLQRSPNAAIARALVIGIARSGTHSKSSLETALGVPVPRID